MNKANMAEVPVTNLETLEMINHYQGANHKFPLIARSMSQDIDPLTVVNNIINQKYVNL
jgi:hypothetical protein